MFKEYSKGQIVFKNGIDHLQYILSHKDMVANLIGVESDDIRKNRRKLHKVKDYINRLQSVCEIGDKDHVI